ncbi:glycosyltransferase [Riemerella columbina]|uniref:glycosyltransferase n=1 Tax=Riemerella columbina TaxID=103810 RepID=UPI00266FCA87|nr:glycosyltransferase [Riemerella columbina]WKS94525.1 glycosyltransferase [Riemerella columbina]
MAKKKEIIFILPDMETGGAERIVMTLANHLPRDLFVPKIMLLRKEGGYLEFLKDIEVIDLKTPRIRHSLKPILREIWKRKPDIVFSGFGEVNAYLSIFTKLFPKTKFIARETNVASLHVTRKEIKFFYRFYNFYDEIIAQSDDMARDLIDNFNIKPQKITKINNPVDFKFIDDKLAQSQLPEAYQLRQFNVVAIGNLSARKGFDQLLKVFSYLKDTPITLHILGDGADREALLQMKEGLQLEQVIFHGKQKNPYQYLKFADLFILSSRYEGFPNVLLEAGACGTFALANDCPGGIREIIQPGVNGEIASIENHQEFAEKITELLTQPQPSSAKIRESIQSRFSTEVIMNQYEQLLSQ